MSLVKLKFKENSFLWTNLKRKYLNKEISSDEMKSANLIRKLIVDGLIKHCIETNKLDAIPISVGTTDLTSDYDLTLNGPDKERVVIEFNNIFESLFNMSSADIFDSNLYGSAPYEIVRMNNNNESCENKFNCSKICLKNKSNECVLMSRLRIPENSHIVVNQRIWALTALVRQCDEKQIQYLIEKIHSPELKLQLDGAIKNFNKYSIKNLSIRQLNAIYGKELTNIHNLKQQASQIQDSDFEHTYADAISRTSFYSQESYVSAGPFLHVVGLNQSQYELILSRNEWIDSFIENCAGVIHQFHSEDNNCVSKFANASKYFMRLAESLLEIMSLLDINDTKEKIKNLFQDASFIRKNKETIIDNGSIHKLLEFARCENDLFFIEFMIFHLDRIYDKSADKCLQCSHPLK